MPARHAVFCTSAILLCLALPCAAHPGPALPTQDAPKPDADLPALEAPPELERKVLQKFQRALKRLRNSNAARRAATEQEIIGFGRGTIPGLMAETHTDHDGLADGLVTCLAALVDLRDRDLVAASLDSEHAVARRFAAAAVGKLGTDALVEAVEPLLEAEDPRIRLEAALSLVRRGREIGLVELALQYGGEQDEEKPDSKPRRSSARSSATKSPTIQERVLAQLPGLKNRGDHRPLRQLLKLDKERQQEEPDVAARERLAAVEMLHAIGDGASVGALAIALEDPHNVVQVRAIDALRELLEDAGPFEGRSIFQQLTEVKRLKEVLGKRGR